EGYFPAEVKAFLAIGGGVHGEAFALESRGKGRAQAGFVLDQQYAHVVSVKRGGPRWGGTQSSRRRGSSDRVGRRWAGPRAGVPAGSAPASRLPRISTRSRSAASRARARSRSMLPVRGNSSGRMRSRRAAGSGSGSRGVSRTRTRPSGVSTLIR